VSLRAVRRPSGEGPAASVRSLSAPVRRPTMSAARIAASFRVSKPEALLQGLLHIVPLSRNVRFCANPLFQPQCPLARSGGRQHNCRLGFRPRAIGDEIGRRLREEIRKVEKTSLLEKCRIRCSDDVGAGRGHAQPFRDRREKVVGETIAFVVSSAGFIAAPTFEAAPRSAGQPFWGRESACGESAKRKGA
jgi:hypothetical protein